MQAVAIEQVYRYPHASALGADRALRLATSSRGGHEHPHFFTGELARPERTARQLLALMDVVHARFHIPAAMLQRILAQSDPVVTSSDDRLRFEGFSGCCGAYARVDLFPEAVRGQIFGRGTTNVDFNPPMLAALASIRGAAPVSLRVGNEEVALETAAGTTVEKKVRLPLRWIKGFLEVQACQRRMQPVADIPGPEAARFLKSLPRMKTHRRATWIVPAGRGLRISQVAPRGTGARVGGLERLRALERLASRAQSLRIYADERTGATGWVLVFDDSRFQLLVSPEVWRGFSGEGQALDDLASSRGRELLAPVRAQLRWNAVIEPEDLARRADVTPELASSALAALGARGLVGFDLDAGAYFHRELPFDLSAVEELQPRLKAARKLVDEDRVRIEGAGVGLDGDESVHVAYVSSGGVEHRVVARAEETTCTCPWYAKHRGARGPCKHVLAVRLLKDLDHDEER